MPKERTPLRSGGRIHKVQASIVHPHQQSQLPQLPQQHVSLPLQYTNDDDFPHHQHHNYYQSYPKLWSIPYPGLPSSPHAIQRNYRDSLHIRDSFAEGLVHSSTSQVLQHPSPTYDDENNEKSHHMSIETNVSTRFANNLDQQIIDPNVYFAGPSPMHPKVATNTSDDSVPEHHQSGAWTDSTGSPTSTLNDTDGGSYLSEHNNSIPGSQDLLINSTYAIGPRDFLGLPGYHGKKNVHGLFECFRQCAKSRFGVRGFCRRANMLVHLRNCHEQAIPKNARARARV